MVCFAMIIGACGKWDDVHQQFVGDGEITYTGKADSVRVRGGLNRLELSWIFTSDPKITKYKVYWNNRQDSLVDNFQRSPKIDTVRLMFDKMEEGTYHFEIFTFDAKGNMSVKSEAIGKVYGEQYQRELLTRAFRSSLRVGKDRLLDWIPADETQVRSELVYKNAEGKQIKKWINRKDEKTILEDIPLGSNFDLRSVFLPDVMALDTFYTNYETVKYDYVWADWKDYKVVFGYHGSLIAMGNGGLLYRSAKNASVGGPMYSGFVQIGNGWNIFETVLPNRNTFIGWYKSIKSVFRYNFDDATVTFTDSRQIASAGWDGFNLVFPFQGAIVARDAVSSKLYRYGVDAAENFSGIVEEIVNADSWKDYVLLSSSGANIFGKTADGKLWCIPIVNNVAKARKLVAENWQNVVSISVHGDDLLAKMANGELFQYPVNPAGILGESVLVTVPIGEKRRLN